MTPPTPKKRAVGTMPKDGPRKRRAKLADGSDISGDRKNSDEGKFQDLTQDDTEVEGTNDELTQWANLRKEQSLLVMAQSKVWADLDKQINSIDVRYAELSNEIANAYAGLARDATAGMKRIVAKYKAEETQRAYLKHRVPKTAPKLPKKDAEPLNEDDREKKMVEHFHEAEAEAHTA